MTGVLEFIAGTVSVDASEDPVGIDFESEDGRYYFAFMAEGSPSVRRKNPELVRVSWRAGGEEAGEVVSVLESVTVGLGVIRAKVRTSKGARTRFPFDAVEIRWNDDLTETTADLIAGLRDLLGERADRVHLEIPGAPERLPPSLPKASMDDDGYE